MYEGIKSCCFTTVQNGMLGGKVKVVEAGSAMVEAAGNPFYKHYSNIVGGIVNFFFLAIHFGTGQPG